MADLVALPPYRHPVSRITAPLNQVELPVRGTVVIADATGWKASDTDALAAYLRSGGRVVLAGPPADSSVLGALLGPGAAPVFAGVGIATATAEGSAPELAGVGTVTTAVDQSGSWSSPGGTTPILVGPDGSALATVADVGPGRLVLLSTATPLQNQLLDHADNAAFAVAVVGSAGRPVAFDEYTLSVPVPATGFGAIPGRWRWGVGLPLACALLLLLWSSIRRFGPPEPRERTFTPPRVQYVEGLATVLAATPEHRTAEALAPVRDAARDRLRRRLGLPEDAPDPAIVQASAAQALPDGLVRAVLTPPRSSDDVMALGRAHVWLAGNLEHRP
jgi:hypothetical protein